MPKRALSFDQYDDDTGVGLNDFLNSLFDPWPGPFGYAPPPLYRAGLLQEIKSAEQGGEEVPFGLWLVTPETSELITAILYDYWLGGGVRARQPRVIDSDRGFIRFVRDYIDRNHLEMLVPIFACAQKDDDGPSRYRLVRQERYSFAGNQRELSVWTFLTLFLLGAHFVVIHGVGDLGRARLPSFFQDFKDLPGAAKAGHSHYTGHKVSLNGQNYPALTLNQEEGAHLDELAAPADAVLLPVVLSDETSNEKPNSFFQMEGWRPGKSMVGVSKYEYRNPALAGGYRHGADFNTHGKTIWNISTYGASPYSEKRGGQVFLAPAAWLDKPHLRAYRGFGGHGAGHAWFKPELVDAT